MIVKAQVSLSFPASVQQHWTAYNVFAYATNALGQSPGSAVAFLYTTQG